MSPFFHFEWMDRALLEPAGPVESGGVSAAGGEGLDGGRSGCPTAENELEAGRLHVGAPKFCENHLNQPLLTHRRFRSWRLSR